MLSVGIKYSMCDLIMCYLLFTTSKAAIRVTE